MRFEGIWYFLVRRFELSLLHCYPQRCFGTQTNFQLSSTLFSSLSFSLLIVLLDLVLSPLAHLVLNVLPDLTLQRAELFVHLLLLDHQLLDLLLQL